VLALACLGVVFAVAAGAITAVGAFATRTRAAAAADLSALAAADAASGRSPGIPCELAGAVARSNGAALSSCVQEGAVVTV